MLSKELLQPANPLEDINRQQINYLLAHNEENFQFLLAFVTTSKNFKIAIAEINFPPDVDALITALQEHPKCQQIQFVVLNLNDSKLRFLLVKIKQDLANIQREPDKKLVLILRGLEKSIGTTDDYPPILVNLNYVRDEIGRAHV